VEWLELTWPADRRHLGTGRFECVEVLTHVSLDGEHSDGRLHKPQIVCRVDTAGGTMGVMRMFVAAILPEHVVEDLEDFLEPRRELQDSGWRWTPPEQWHITLAFLGDVPERCVDDLEERLVRAARKRAAMTLQLRSGATFPHVGAARVLYAAPTPSGETDAERDQGSEELRRLATGARAAASKAGIEVDGARFRPHVTLARRNRPLEATRWVRILEGYTSPDWLLHEIALVQSHLGEGPPGRPRYETLAAFSLHP
jgi:2'-5' RNA ligase